MIVNTGGHYVAIVKGIPGKDNYTFIDSMNISNLPTFKTEESLLQHLISRNYSNYLFVYGTGKSEKTPTFEMLDRTKYMELYEKLEKVEKLREIIVVLQQYYTSDGLYKKLNMHELQSGSVIFFQSDQSVNLDSEVNLDSDIFKAVSNAVFANPQILESQDIVDEIVVAQNDVDNDSNEINFNASDLKKIFEDYNTLSKLVNYMKSDDYETTTQYLRRFTPFYSCIKLYSDDVPTVLKKLERHYVTSIYTLCSSCNRDRDPTDWCNPYTFIDEDKETVKAGFNNSVENMSAFIKDPSTDTLQDEAMKRFKKLVELNKDNFEKLNPVISVSATGNVTSNPVTMDNRFEVLSRFAFADQKSKYKFNKEDPRKAIKKFEPLFDAVQKSSSGNKTHKLRIKNKNKNKNKTKSFRHKTRNTINRL